MPNYVTVLELQRAMKLYPMGRSMPRKDLVGPKRVIVTESLLTVRVNEFCGDLTSAVLRLRWWTASAVSRESGKGGRYAAALLEFRPEVVIDVILSSAVQARQLMNTFRDMHPNRVRSQHYQHLGNCPLPLKRQYVPHGRNIVTKNLPSPSAVASGALLEPSALSRSATTVAAGTGFLV